MSSRAVTHTARVLRRERLGAHLVRLVLGGDGLAGFVSTGVPDEWVGLVVPGQFQSRYYTVRHWTGSELTLDVVVHDEGLVTGWASTDCTGDTVTITEAKGSFAPPADAGWVVLVGDLTALPAIARAGEELTLPTRALVEAPERPEGYLPDDAPHLTTTWVEGDGSGLAALVEGLDLPDGPGYFWMAGESAQMRAIRKHLMRERRLPSTHYDVMGYWRRTTARQPRAVDPGPIYRAGKAAGHSDEQIWAAYDDAQQEAPR